MLQLIQRNFNGIHLLCFYLFVQNMFEVGICHFNKVLTCDKLLLQSYLAQGCMSYLGLKLQ